MPLPAIVHTQENQWIVLYDIEKKWVSIADPMQGLRRISRSEFEQQWSGYAVLFDYIKEVEKTMAQTEELNSHRRKVGFRWMWPFFRPLAGSMLTEILPIPSALNNAERSPMLWLDSTLWMI